MLIFAFQLTASRRGWRISFASVILPASISTHSLTKRLTAYTWEYPKYVIFQLTASRRGWQTYAEVPRLLKAFQLTASRRGWRLLTCRPWPLFRISTHSLTKRLTTRTLISGMASIFQLTASRRGWRLCSQSKDIPRIFQLTASRRGWHITTGYAYRYTYISTHSLTKRLTQLINCEKQNSNISTHSLTKRLTRTTRKTVKKWKYFNSQPHEEADDAGKLVLFYDGEISTHSLTKRLTAAKRIASRPARYFNSQPHEEADKDWFAKGRFIKHFNSQPHEEADRRTAAQTINQRNFNSQPHEEAD